MPSHEAISGNYTVTWGGTSLGRTDQGWTWEVAVRGEVLRFDDFGECPIDLVQRGAEVYVETVIKEWTLGVRGALWPIASSIADVGAVECPGEMAVLQAFAQPLVFTPAACTPAAADSDDDVITFHKTYVDPDLVSRINLNNMPRLIPLRFICFLTTSNLKERFFTIA